jgi:MFS family permease
MFKHTTASPVTFLFLVLPYGISSGFLAVTLPYLLVKNGFSVAEAAAITAIGLTANIWRFIWAPLADMSLSLHKWYFIGTCLCAMAFLMLVPVPVTKDSKTILTIIVLFLQMSATLVISPVGGFMAKTIREEMKGRAGGWYQAGNLGGAGIGGGAGVWLAVHFSYKITVIIFALSVLACAFALFFMPQVYAEKGKRLKEQFGMLVSDIRDLTRSANAVFTTLIVLTPIGIGASSFMWSSVAENWDVSSGTVALIAGTLNGVVCAAGSVTGGWIADKMGRWTAFFGAGIFMAAVTCILSFSAYVPVSYILGVLCYAFTFGMANAGFSTIILHAIGKGMASTKYALISSLGNIPSVYMTAFNGWMHDAYGIKYMLLGETFIGLFFVVIALILLNHLKVKQKISAD